LRIKAKNLLLIAISIFILIGSIAAFLFLGDTPMKKLYLSEVQTELDKSIVSHETFKEEDIANLPLPVQLYFRNCGYIGKEKMSNAKLVWADVNFKMNPDNPWSKIKYEQYNFVSEPARLAYIYATIFDIIPFDGRDKYLNGQGNMLAKLKTITLFDVSGSEMNVSAAVTYLSEALLVPACALQPYISWETIDQTHAKATLEYKGVKAEGLFTFNNNGEFIKFETDDRYMDTDNGTAKKTKWTVVATNYIEKDGLKLPSRLKAIWNLPSGDYEYFDGTLKDIVYNNPTVKVP